MATLAPLGVFLGRRALVLVQTPLGAPLPGENAVYVLVIEDDRFNRTLYRDLLEAEGFAVVLASSAAAGLAQARAEPPALVVMDIELPDLDGLLATAELRADPRTEAVPVLVISAHADPAHEAGARAAGANGFSCKPLRFPDFQQLVRSLADGAPRG